MGEYVPFFYFNSFFFFGAGNMHTQTHGRFVLLGACNKSPAESIFNVFFYVSEIPLDSHFFFLFGKSLRLIFLCGVPTSNCCLLFPLTVPLLAVLLKCPHHFSFSPRGIDGPLQRLFVFLICDGMRVAGRPAPACRAHSEFSGWFAPCLTVGVGRHAPQPAVRRNDNPSGQREVKDCAMELGAPRPPCCCRGCAVCMALYCGAAWVALLTSTILGFVAVASGSRSKSKGFAACMCLRACLLDVQHCAACRRAAAAALFL
ncbi:hypothetical protein TcCL_ESM04719 [Trypanosoma cruzi]|nr:hypothetical protein TcCL_ESM04719 [Trypanosoma cruzi]